MAKRCGNACFIAAVQHHHNFAFLNTGLLGAVTESCGGLEPTAPPAVSGSNACRVATFYILHILLPFTVGKGVEKIKLMKEKTPNTGFILLLCEVDRS